MSPSAYECANDYSLQLHAKASSRTIRPQVIGSLLRAVFATHAPVLLLSIDPGPITPWALGYK